MNPNQVFCFAFAILPLQIIDMQQQQMFAFFILYQRWVNEYMQILNVAFLRRRRYLCRIHVVPYRWTIPRPAKSWFDAHNNDLTHTFTRTLFSSCGQLSYCFFFFSAWLEWVRLLLSLTTLDELLL